ncbi:molecular chaperone MKKS-like [Lineus longissimus]|uniref:molecular chaperone MKKS-like n=1 Tax=Lineus longissimus TaxID=88925 RepID=UPI00315D2A55
MSAVSPGTRVAAQQPSEISQKHLEDRETRDSVALLLSIVKSCYGPLGRLKMIQNASGGHVTVTSSASRLFPVLTISKPVLKLVTSAVQTHLQQFNDGGLFSSLLSLFMIKISLNLADVNRILMCDVLDYLKKFCMDVLLSRECNVKFDLDFSNIDMMLMLLRNIMGTKRGCSLNDAELHHVCQLVLETFLKTFREYAKGNDFSHVDIVAVEGVSPLKSYFMTGVLFEKRHSEKLGQHLDFIRLQRGDSMAIRCCLVDISLSGDSGEFLDIVFETDTDHTLGDGIIEMILRLCKKFESDGVGIVFCQKVIHPAVQQFLREKGVLAIDRLGSASAKAVLELTGCIPISSLIASTSADSYGYIDTIDHLELGKKHFYHIKSSQSLVSTVALHGRNEEALAELQHVFRVGLDTLQMAVYKKHMVPGGGCLETCLASTVRNHVLTNEEKLMTNFSCSRSTLCVVTQTFLHSLESVATTLDPNSHHFTDNVTNHHWTARPNSSIDVDYSKILVECCCGMIQNDATMGLQFREIFPVCSQTFLKAEAMGMTPDLEIEKRSPRVFDPLQAKLHAFHIAMSTASMVLRVGNFISDTN